MSRTAVICGVGPGLGAALVRRFARGEYNVGMVARSAGYIQSLAAEFGQGGARVLPVTADITSPSQVARAFAQVREELGAVDVLINHAGNAAWKGFFDLTPEDFELSWRVCAYGSLLCCKEAAGDMVSRNGGAILFTGATSAVRGRPGALAFSSAKFAVRGLAWSLARELGPRGIHVAHIIIDGVLDTPRVRAGESLAEDGPLLDVDAAAGAYWDLVQQDRSAWTFEIDLRPHDEDFFT